MSTATAEPRSQEEIVRRYQTMTAECDKLVEKITELEFDRNEHSLVEETLQPIDAGRKAYRLVGGVLVERTVGEVLPSVKTNKENVSVDSRVGWWWAILGRSMVLMCPGVSCISHQKFHPFNQSLRCTFNNMQLDAVIGPLKDRLETMQKDAAEWKAKYNLKTQEEIQALQRQQQMA